MSLLIVGSVALDTISTPFGKVERELGGSATYASFAASLYTPVAVVGVVGQDFKEDYFQLFSDRNINTSGIQKQDGETFHWEGFYEHDLNVAHTKKTELGVFEKFRPSQFDSFSDYPLVFLGNIDPELQLDVIEKTREHSPFVAMDSMNYWIETKREKLEEVIRHVNLVLMNEAEIRQFTGQYNLIFAAQQILKLGPKYVVVKQGEYGCLLFTKDEKFHTSFLFDRKSARSYRRRR